MFTKKYIQLQFLAE
jgi:hypothetical protein